MTNSSDTTKKWLMGCGIGCGVVILILALLGVGGFFFIRNIVQGFKDTEAIMSTLTETYGRVKEYCPDPDGAIRSDRIEAFLSARAAFTPVRDKIGRSLQILSDAKNVEEIEVKTPRNVFKMIRLGFGLVPQIADFFKGRNQALLDERMGMGEYYYIYVIAYYSWLSKKPEDGPDFQFVDREGEYNYDLLDEEEVREERRERILRRLHRQILPMLKNQYAKLTESNVSGVPDKWREILAAEIKAMEEDRERLPWQEGLPEHLIASFRPFRERLEESYNEMTNPLEVVLEQR